MTLYDVAIIGGGPGGYTAALYCAQSGLSVLVLERLGPGGQMATTDEVDNYPGFDAGINGFELAERMRRGAERFGAQTRFTEVKQVQLRDIPKRLETGEGTVLARTVILATGAYPRTLGLPREEELRGRGVAYCATCDGMFYRGRTVAVVGGGNSAVEDALYLSKLCKKVYLIHRRDTFRASEFLVKKLSESGVALILESRVTELHGGEALTGISVESIPSGERQLLPCDGLFIAVGRIPDTAPFRGQMALNSEGYLIADESTRTDVPGVFAVGDAREKPLRQIVTAAADGAVAAHFAGQFLLASSGVNKTSPETRQ